MSTDNTNSLNNVFKGRKRQTKDKHFTTQNERVYRAFDAQSKTMKQVEQETGVIRSCICWYVGKWKKTDKIGVAYLGVCPITKTNGVQFLTTDPDLFLIPKNVK